jgi:hypothetical protein
MTEETLASNGNTWEQEAKRLQAAVDDLQQTLREQNAKLNWALRDLDLKETRMRFAKEETKT